MISTAVPSDALSRVLGTKLIGANFQNNTPYLPQNIAILGEANTANQSGLTTDPFDFTSAKQVGDKFGYGSPLHQMARIIRPDNANILGGIKTTIYPQITDAGATATVITEDVVAAGDVTENAVHTIIINGRRNVDSGRYSYNVYKGETAIEVRARIIDTVSNVLGCPFTVAENIGNELEFTSKWKGLSSAEVNIEFDTAGIDAGITYVEVSKVAGIETVDITPSLNLIGSEWVTLLLNPYGTSELDELKAFVGKPDPETPTGRYNPIDFKPFMAFWGSTLSTVSSITAITNVAARLDDVCNVHCPAPNSKGFTWEAAANMILSVAPIANNTPHLGNGGRVYFDMPIPKTGDIGEFVDYDNRNELAKKGSSTVTLNAGAYMVQDCQTTWHPVGENPPKYRKVRDNIVLWNVQFRVRLLMEEKIQDKAIVSNIDPVRVKNIISPKLAYAEFTSLFKDLASLALIVNSAFSIETLQTGINTSNPARIDVQFKIKISSTADVVSEDTIWDFNFTF